MFSRHERINGTTTAHRKAQFYAPGPATISKKKPHAAVYLDFAETPMGQYCRRQIFWNTAYFLLVCAVDFRPLLLGGLFKLVVSLAVACLVALVVVHSANICRLIIACLHALPTSYFPLTVNRRGAEPWQPAAAIPTLPGLSPLFQRPPPLFSL